MGQLEIMGRENDIQSVDSPPVGFLPVNVNVKVRLIPHKFAHTNVSCKSLKVVVSANDACHRK